MDFRSCGALSLGPASDGTLPPRSILAVARRGAADADPPLRAAAARRAQAHARHTRARPYHRRRLPGQSAARAPATARHRARPRRLRAAAGVFLARAVGGVSKPRCSGPSTAASAWPYSSPRREGEARDALAGAGLEPVLIGSLFPSKTGRLVTRGSGSGCDFPRANRGSHLGPRLEHESP